MKFLKFLLLTVSAFVLCSLVGHAQEYNNAELQAIGVFNQNSLKASQGIFITQIGNKNQIAVDAKIDQQDMLDITQIGDRNYVIKHKNVDNLQETVKQFGNMNRIFDYSINPLQNSNTEFVQEGNALNIHKYGTNNLSDNLRIYMSGNYRSITIRNF